MQASNQQRASEKETMREIHHNNTHKRAGRKALIGVAGVLLLAGCGKQERYETAPSGGDAMKTASNTQASDASGAAPSAPAAKESMARDDSAQKGTLTPASLNDAQPDRYLIRNATLSIETPDVHKVAAQLVALAHAAQGYVSDSHETVDGLGAHEITLSLRVPAQRFEASMQQIEAQGKTLDKQVTTEDVTEEFVDSQARLRNLKSAELRLLDHLSKTGKLSDTLLIEKELTRERQEIEQIEGRLKFLAHRIAYSTFSLTVHETPRAQSIIPPQTFSGGKVASDAARSVVDFGQSLLGIVIWLAVWAVVWLPLAFAGRLLLARRRHTTARKVGAETSAARHVQETPSL